MSHFNSSNPRIPSGTPSFLSPDFIHFPGSTPVVPPQPQYPSSDANSSTPSTPASTRTSSSSSGGSAGRPKVRTYDQDPKYPDDAVHWHSKHNGKCPQCREAGRHGALTKPKWHSERKRLFIRCKNTTCKFFRYTDYYSDPPSSNLTPASAVATTASVPLGVTLPCLAEPCSTGNKRNRNVECKSQMCLQDCVKSGTSDCTVHRRAKQGYLSGSAPGRPPAILFQGPSLSSMPSIPMPSTNPMISPLDAAPPPSSPNPPNPRSLLDITTSTVKPSLENPLPLPAASPLQEGPTFQEVRRYARDLPHDWATVITAQQTAKAQQMLYEAQFRSQIKEGLSVTVVFWRARLGVAPYLFERVVHTGIEYSLSEDVDLCSAVGFDPKTVFILTYLGGMWSHRSPRERHRVRPGSFLFFREAGPELVAYEDTLLRFDELLALSTDPGFGGASTFLATPPTAVPSGPRPRPRPKNRPLGLPKIDHRYNWITVRNAPFAPSATSASTEAPSEPTSSPPAVSSTAGSSTSNSSAPSDPTSPLAASSIATSSSMSDSSPPTGLDNTRPKRSWPDEYTIKEIHEGFVAITNKGRARKGAGIRVHDRFLETFPDAERWVSGRYYAAMETWKGYVIEGERPARNAFKAWLKTDALWTSIFGSDIHSPAPKKRKIEILLFEDSD